MNAYVFTREVYWPHGMTEATPIFALSSERKVSSMWNVFTATGWTSDGNTLTRKMEDGSTIILRMKRLTIE